MEKKRKNKGKKGEIITSKIRLAFPKADGLKMSTVLNLINKSDDLLEQGNYLAHSRTLDYYENEINEYKKKKNLKNLVSPVAFSFLINLGIPDDSFFRAYSFLSQYFDNDLTPIDPETLFAVYFR